MSAAQLFNIPRDARGRAEWSHANADEHQQIVFALIQKSPGLQLAQFVLDPIAPDDVQNFLLRHQLMHNQFDELLGIGGNDYSSLNPLQPTSVETIWQQHANEHLEARVKLGLTG